MAGNMSDDEVDESNNDNKFVDIVSGFLLDREIRDICTLDELRSNFPPKYRTHGDIEVLYESFVMKRKLIKDTVEMNIKEFYTKERIKNNHKQEQSMEEKLAVLESKKKQVKKDLLKAKKDLSTLQQNITRCDEAVQDCHLLSKNVKEYFNMDVFEELGTQCD